MNDRLRLMPAAGKRQVFGISLTGSERRIVERCVPPWNGLYEGGEEATPHRQVRWTLVAAGCGAG